MRNFQAQHPMGAPDPSWPTFSLSVAKGKTHAIQDWTELNNCFHVLGTKDIGIAHDFFCDRLEPRDPFPHDRQWICVTNKLVNQNNLHLQ
jgi:hypothetical protein